MNKILTLALVLLLSFGFISCDKNDAADDPNVERVFTPDSETLQYISNGLSLPASESFVNLGFYSSKSWSIDISYTSEQENWLSVNRKSGKAGEISIELTVEENVETSNRSAIITITSGGINEYITVSQKSVTNTAIHVGIPGTLCNYIAMDARPNITDLTITGMINGTDIKFIRSLFDTLDYLDLSNATIVRGGDEYGDPYYPNCQTMDYAVSAYMFMNYKGRELKIPDNTEYIGYMCFFGLPNLTELKIPEGVESMSGCAFAGLPSLKTFTIPKNVVVEEREGYFTSDNLSLSSFPKLEALTVLSPYLTLWLNLCENLNTLELYCNLKEYSLCQPHPNLTSVILHEGITQIPQWTFTDCPNLKIITIPSTVDEIGWHAFVHYDDVAHISQSYLEELHCKCTKNPWKSTLLEGFSNCKLYIPKGTRSEYSSIAYNFEEVVEE